MDYFNQKTYSLFILITSIVTFFYFRNKDKEFIGRDKLFFVLGSVFVVINCFFVQLTYGSDVLFECLLLKKLMVSAKLIPIGYIFILLSVFFFIDDIIKKIFSYYRSKPS